MATRHMIRNNRGGLTKVSLTASSAIKAFCYECMGFNFYEVERCTDLHCPLYPFRNPAARKGTREVSEKSIQALQKSGGERRQSLITSSAKGWVRKNG